MLICLDQRTGTGCETRNRDGATYCQQCGKSLRYALELHNPGTIIGTYRIITDIGYGSFGAVYQAEVNTKPGYHVALKETFDPESIRAFQDEFALLHRLQHDHLPKYYEMFEAHGNGYLVMEFIPGQSLLEILEKRQWQPLVESQVKGYAIQLCEVLTYLHEQTPPLIHRDIKPANIRLTPDGLIKLVDFGLIKQGTNATLSSRKGLTPAYASLEQWGGKGIHTTPQSDIYSLGASLYHLLTGKLPEFATDRLAKSSDPLLPPHQLNPRLSVQVSDAIMHAMALLAENRFANGATFAHALFHGTSTPVVQPSPKPTPVVQPSPKPTPVVQPPPQVVQARANPLFPVTTKEWRDELTQRNERFGHPTGYWCYVQGGDYLIGGWEANQSVETITLPKFWIGKHPITVQQYRQFITASGYTTERWWTPNGWKWRTEEKSTQPKYWDDQRYTQPNQPVIGITWYEAMAYATWLNEQLKDILPAGYVIRLPTEAEWEVAAAYDGTGMRRLYPWGEEEPTPERAVFSISEKQRRKQAEGVGQRPVGAAACGAHDMAGNVYEWTMSGWHGYPQQSGKVVDNFTNTDWVVIRGSSWYLVDITYLRCGFRSRLLAFDRYYGLGGARLLLGSSRL